MDRRPPPQYKEVTVIRTLLFATLLPLLYAQSPPVLVTTTTQPDGHITYTIQNRTDSTITAYFYKRIGWSLRPDGSKAGSLTELGYKDSALEHGTDPIPSHQQLTQTAPNGEVSVLAVLWADGSTYGDPEWVHRLQTRRVLAQQHIDNAMAVLQKALDSGADSSTVIAQLELILQQLTPLKENPDNVFLSAYYQGPIHSFGNPIAARLDGAQVYLTDREIIKHALDNLQQLRDRLLLYR